jgi:hypothetical protein
MKGSVFDIPVIFIIILFIAISIIFGFIVLSNFGTAIDGMSDMPTEAKAAVSSIITIYKFFDAGLAILFVGLVITTVLLARNIPTHPVYFILSVLAMVIVMIFCYVIKEIYSAIASNAAVVAYSNQFPLTALLMDNIPMLALGIFVLISFAMYTSGGESIELAQ